MDFINNIVIWHNHQNVLVRVILDFIIFRGLIIAPIIAGLRALISRSILNTEHRVALYLRNKNRAASWSK